LQRDGAPQQDFSDEDKRFYLSHADLVVVAIGKLGRD
jgi:hypothetical protein